MMSEQYIWPLIGVLLGWMLTLLTTGLRDRSERRKAMGYLLAKLIRVIQQIQIIIPATDNMKDLADDWKGFEAIRKREGDTNSLIA